MLEQKIREEAFDFFRKNQLKEGAETYLKLANEALTHGDDAAYVICYLFHCRFEILLGAYNETKEKLKNLNTNYKKHLAEGSYNHLLYQFILASTHHYLGDVDISYRLSEDAILKHQLKSTDDDFLRIDHALVLLLHGKSCWRKRKLTKAFKCFLEVLKNCFHNRTPRLQFIIAKTFNLIGAVLSDIPNDTLARKYLDLSKQLYDSTDNILTKKHLYEAALYSDIANNELRVLDEGLKKSPDLANKTIENSLESIKGYIDYASGIFNKIYGKKPHRYKAWILRLEARYHRNTSSEKAHKKLEQELCMRNTIFNNKKHGSIARIYNHLARLKKGAFEEKMNYVQMAIVTSLSDFDKKEWKHTPIITVNQNRSETQLLKGLHFKAELLIKQYKEKEDVFYLNLAFETIKAGIDLINEITASNLTNPESRFILIDQTRPLHAIAIEILFLVSKNNDNHAFPTSLTVENIYKQVQLSTGYLLYNDVHSYLHPAEMEYGLNIERAKVFKLPYVLEKPIPLFEAYINQESNFSNEKLSSYLKRVVDKEVIEQQEDFVPPILPPSFSIDTIQSHMTDDKGVILSFFCCPEAVYGIYIAKEKFLVKKCVETVAEVNRLEKEIDTFRHLIYERIPDYKINKRSTVHTYESPINDYVDQAYRIYKKLISPFVNALANHSINRMYIIPDDFLWTLDFDALVVSDTRKENFHELPYLLHEYCIGYHFSVPLFHKLYWNGKKQTSIGTFLYVLASVKYENEFRIAQKTLEKWQKLETQNRGTESDSKNFLDITLFSKGIEQFLKYTKSSNAVIIRSHGSVDEEQIPRLNIGVGDEKLTPQNIRKLNRIEKTFGLFEFLILHSCQSGGGDIRKGEGIIALSRAFMAIGTKNIIYTTNDVKIIKSSELLTTFWEILFKNKTDSKISIAKALNRAKIKFSKKEDSYPNDWCSIQFVGDQTREIN